MSNREEVKFCFCLISLEAKDPERVSAGGEPPRGVRPGSRLLRLPLLLPVLQTAAGRTLQTAALQAGEYRPGSGGKVTESALREEASVTQSFEEQFLL